MHHDQRQNKSKILQIKVFRTLQVNFNQIGLLFTDWADFYSFWWPFFTLATCHFKQIFEQPIKINPILAGWGLTGDRFGSGHLFGGWMIDWSFYLIHGSHFSISNCPIKNWFGVGILGFSRIGRLFFNLSGNTVPNSYCQYIYYWQWGSEYWTHLVFECWIAVWLLIDLYSNYECVMLCIFHYIVQYQITVGIQLTALQLPETSS